MTTKLTLALAALITGTAFGSIPAVLPEFRNAEQLAEWRDDMAAKASPAAIASEDHAFFTGKPYVDSTRGYAFKYRSYDPALARWTSEDPSGFPDGANNNKYVDSPSTQFDVQGLVTVKVMGRDFDLGSIKNLGNIEFDIPGTTYSNNTQDPMTVTYSIQGTFNAAGKFMDFGLEGTQEASTSVEAVTRPGYNIKLIIHLDAHINPVPGISFIKWEVKTYE